MRLSCTHCSIVTHDSAMDSGAIVTHDSAMESGAIVTHDSAMDSGAIVTRDSAMDSGAIVTHDSAMVRCTLMPGAVFCNWNRNPMVWCRSVCPFDC